MAAATQELEQFVRDALGRGAPKASIEAALVQAGWPPEQYRAVLDGWADVDFQVPVPRPRPYLSARDAFFYLLLFTALWISAWNLGALLFAFIDRAWPDPAMRDSGARFRDSIRWSTTNLLVAFPLFAEYAVGHANGRRPRKALVHERERMVAALKEDAVAAQAGGAATV